MPTPVDAVLHDAHEWLSEGEHRWTRGVRYRVRDGVNPFHQQGRWWWNPAGPDVTSTCLAGSIERARLQHGYDLDVEQIALQRLAVEIDGALSTNVLVAPGAVVADFNDDRATTYSDAVLMLKRTVG